MAKALEEDPSVFEYDTIYDEMSERKKAPLRAKKDVKVRGHMIVCTCTCAYMFGDCVHVN